MSFRYGKQNRLCFCSTYKEYKTPAPIGAYNRHMFCGRFVSVCHFLCDISLHQNSANDADAGRQSQSCRSRIHRRHGRCYWHPCGRDMLSISPKKIYTTYLYYLIYSQTPPCLVQFPPTCRVFYSEQHTSCKRHLGSYLYKRLGWRQLQLTILRE